MGYQALLFCPDEKLARVVSQVFSELDFTVEPVHEPFAAVKRLMSQRYDAIVVDCENEQNASLLFKSARNSGSNQSSLAIALVEGQAGVAKAYRIGANLVLTKPINVEQAKGTLRVARGLLRKNSDAAASSLTTPATPRTAAAPAASSSSGKSSSGNAWQTASRSTDATTAPLSRPEFHEPEAPTPVAIPAGLPAAAASAPVEDEPAGVSAPAAHNRITIAAEPEMKALSPAVPGATESDIVRNDVAQNDGSGDSRVKTAAAFGPAQNSGYVFQSTTGSAAATAPAKEATSPPAQANRSFQAQPASLSAAHSSPIPPSPVLPSPVRAPQVHAAHDTGPVSISSSMSDAPSFAALDLDEKESEGSGRTKKILSGAAVVLALLAILVYFGYRKTDKPSPASAPQTSGAPQSSAAPAPAPVPAPGPVVVPSASKADQASFASSNSVSPKGAKLAAFDKPSVAVGNSAVARITLDTEAETKKPELSPIVVKSNPAAATKKQPQADEPAPALPTDLAEASTSEGNLSGLMSESPTLPKAATVKVSQGVSEGLLIKRVQPKYPQAALALHAEGAVQIEATINKDGKVTNLKVLSGDPVLVRAALEAVRQWRYKPYALDGQPVEIQTQITVNFKAN